MADPHLFVPESNRSDGLGAAAMDADDETGGKNGEKGGRNEAEGENVNVVVPTGANDDLDANRTQVNEGHSNDRITGMHDSRGEQYLRETGWSAKNSELGVMETTGNSTGATARYDGEPTESDVIDKLDGSVGFRDRSQGGEFVLVEGGRRKLEAPGTMRAPSGKTMGTANTADTELASRKEYETNQKAISDAVMKEKERFEMESQRLGLKQTTSLATQISKGKVGSSSQCWANQRQWRKRRHTSNLERERHFKIRQQQTTDKVQKYTTTLDMHQQRHYQLHWNQRQRKDLWQRRQQQLQER
jgi:hypothetical protein